MKKQLTSWLDRHEYPFQPNFIDLNGHSLHFVDEGQGDPIVFLHGTPSWSFDFRHLILELRKTNRCIAADHLGFGLSDKGPDFDYSLRHHGDNLAQLIQKLELKNITLVLHDFGGPIGLDYALKNPENIKNLILLNTWTGSSENEPAYKKLKKILRSPLLPFLYLHLNFSARFLMPASFGSRKPSRRIKKQYTKPFPTKNTRYGTLAFAKSLLNDQPYFEDQANRLHLLAKKPVLLIWGLKDAFIGPNYLKRFQNLLPLHQILEIPAAGHFPQEEAPELIIPAIRHFLKS